MTVVVEMTIPNKNKLYSAVTQEKFAKYEFNSHMRLEKHFEQHHDVMSTVQIFNSIRNCEKG